MVTRIAESISSGSPRERVERAALAFLTYVKEQPDGFVVLSRGVPDVSAPGGMSSLLNDVAERVGDVFAAAFKQAGYDPKAAPVYAHALVGMVTFVGQWWTETRASGRKGGEPHRRPRMDGPAPPSEATTAALSQAPARE